MTLSRSLPWSLAWFVVGWYLPAASRGQSVNEFPIPCLPPCELLAGTPEGVTAGPNGSLWFVESGTSGIVGRLTAVGQITTGGVITQYPTPATEGNSNKIGRITTAGAITEFSIPTGGSVPIGIAAGPDGNLWFTERGANQIGRLTTAGVISKFSIPTPGSLPLGIAAGQDGNLWFTEPGSNQIGWITTSGIVTEFSVLTPGSGPGAITAGPDGNLWFTELSAFQIGRITTSGGGSANCSPNVMTLCLNGGRFAVTARWVTAKGAEGSGQARPMTDDTGAFWFLGPSNIEVVTKVLAACGDPFHSFWVFAGD